MAVAGILMTGVCQAAAPGADGPAAQYALARHYAGATGAAFDERKAVLHLRQAAQQGLLAAQVDLAFLYLNGNASTPKDMAAAFTWFGKAAAQGSVAAQCQLGDFYRDGTGGAPRNDAKAVALYRQSAATREGCAARSQYQLYLAYAAGRGVPKHPATAAAWLKRAAGAGNPVAQAALGRAYLRGEGMARDQALGRAWLARARAGVAPHDNDEDHDDSHAPQRAPTP